MRANQTRISANQVFWMLLITQIVTTALLAFRTTIQISKQDAWMSVLIGGIIGLIMTLCILQAGLQNADRTIIMTLQKLIGKWAMRAAVLPYLVFSMVAIGLNLKEFMTFVHLALFDRTPLWVLIVIFFCTIVYLTSQGGIEGVGRCAQLIGPCLIAVVIFVTIMNFNFLDVHQILPIYYDSGIQGVLSGSFISVFLFGQTMILLMLIPFVHKPERVSAAGIWSVIFATILMTMNVLAELMLFGPHLSADMLNPTFEYARFISSMDFIENIDSIVVVFWIAGYFITFSMYLFIISYGITQWLSLRRWNIGIAICSIVVVTVSLIPLKFHMADIAIRYMGWFITLVVIHFFVLPVVFWIVGHKRQRSPS